MGLMLKDCWKLLCTFSYTIDCLMHPRWKEPTENIHSSETSQNLEGQGFQWGFIRVATAQGLQC